MTLVNVETGELTPVDQSSAMSVIGYLENARTWLATAVEETGPEQIAMAKAQIATAAEATKQLNLSKEIQLDAQEMVRRAEYALDRSIRSARANGEMANPTGPKSSYMRSGKLVNVDRDHEPTGISARDLFGGNAEARSDAYQMGAAEPEDFDEAIEEAKSEGNLSRANVVRKVKQKAGPPTTRDSRADLIEDLAAQGYSSRQMPGKVGVAEGTIRQIARDHNIEIPADRSVGNTRRINSTQVVINTATALEGLVAGVELVDFDALNIVEVRQWATSLTESMRTLNRFVKQIKEMTQ